MAPGFLSLFDPGTSVSVTLVADSSGNVAGLNDAVEITGENSSHTEVSVVENAGAGVATVETLPREYDASASYSAGDEIGEATVLLRDAVDWIYPTTDGALSAGDVVVSDAGGTAAAYDPQDTGAGHTPDQIFGRVWTTLSRGAQTADKVAVVRD